MVNDHFSFEKCGMVKVKGKGKIETCFLIDCKKQYMPTPTSPNHPMSGMSTRSPAALPPLLFNSNQDVDLVKSLMELATELENTRSNESEGELLSDKIDSRDYLSSIPL
jgi:hypothetical protein